MKAVLILAFAAVASAQYYDEPVIAFDDIPVSPALTRAVFHKFGFAKPAFDDQFVSFARSLGASDPLVSRLYSLYDEPAVLFFADPAGGVVSYYADAGVDRAILSPELRSVFPSVLGASDSLAIAYHPERFLGSYRSVLPKRFFVPSQSPAIAKVLHYGDEFPLPVEHAIFKKSEIADIFPDVSPIYAKFDIDEFPFAYKSPVALSFDADYAALPSSALYAKSAFPAKFGVPHYHPLYAKSAYPFSINSPAYIKDVPALRSDIPVIPTLKFPKDFASYEPVIYAKPAYKVVPYSVAAAPAPIAAAAPVVEPFSIEEAELKSFPHYLRSFPSYYPSYPAYRFAYPYYPARFPAAAAAPAHVASAAPIAAAAPVVEPFSIEEAELKSFPHYLKSFPSYYPNYPALRFASPYYPATPSTGFTSYY